MTEGQQNREIRFIDVVKTCFKFKYLIISITLAITILGTLFLQLFYNNANSYYVSNFALYYTDVPAVVNTDVDFSFGDEEFVEKVKQNDKLNGVDFEAFQEANMGLKFDMTVGLEDRVLYANFPYSRDAVYYTWAVRSKEFNSKEQAMEFLNTLTTTAISSTREKIENIKFDNKLSLYEQAHSYEEEVSYLTQQANEIKAYYNELISLYKGSLVVVGGATLNNRLEDISLVIKNMDLSGIENSVENNSYVKFLPVYDNEGNIVNYQAGERYKRNIDNQIYTINKDIIKTTEAYNLALTQAVGDTTGSWNVQVQNEFEKLQNLKEDLERLEKCKVKMDKVVSATSPEYVETQEIAQSLTDRKQQLKEIVEMYRQDLLSIYDNEYRIMFESTKVMEETGGIGIILSVLLSFVIGFIISLIAVFFANTFKQSKKELAIENGQEKKVKEKEE